MTKSYFLKLLLIYKYKNKNIEYMSLVGKKFPSVSVKATDYLGDEYKINIGEKVITKDGIDYEIDSKILLFWYPKDFTFVCPTELFAFQEATQKFSDRNTMIIGASTDTVESHFFWLNHPKDEGGTEGVKYPILADSTRALSRKLGILDLSIENEVETGDNVAYRATYLIDEDGKVFHESVNDMPIGRNVDEYLRLIDAYTYVQKNGEVCPANWEEGKEAMSPTRDGVSKYLSNN